MTQFLRRYVRSALAILCFGAMLGSAGCSLLGSDTTLVVWERETGDMTKAVDALLAQFMEAHPNVEVFQAHFKDADHLRSSFMKSLNGKDAPSVIFETNDFGAREDILGQLNPVDGLVSTTGLSRAAVASVSDRKGTVYGIPITAGNHLMLYVNRRLIAKAPETFEEMVRLARQWTDPRSDRVGLAYNYWEPFFFIPLLSAFGGRPLENGRPMLDSPSMNQALEFAASLLKEGAVLNSADSGKHDWYFMQGKSAMHIDGDWNLRRYEAALKKDLIVAPLPRLDSTGRYLGPLVTGKSLFMRGRMGSGRQKSAQTFMEFVSSKPAQSMLARNFKILPAREEAWAAGDPLLAQAGVALMHGEPLPMENAMGAVWDGIRARLKSTLEKASQQLAHSAPHPQEPAGRRPASVRH